MGGDEGAECEEGEESLGRMHCFGAIDNKDIEGIVCFVANDE